ncbi:Protein kinase domain-containing protein [Aphelenchoides besseyi]|nr:Protein kinase domain-containing protein [Aphelenchoides besseyi]
MANNGQNAQSNSEYTDRLPNVGDVLLSETNRSYTLSEVIGSGGYGTVFKANRDTRSVALKAEKMSKTLLKVEIAVLKAANQRRCKHFCQLFDFGRTSKDFFFIVLTLLGPDLAKLRNEMHHRHFTLSTALRVAIQTSSAIEELHAMGFVSRDVKPGNFGIGNKNDKLQRIIYMFDFGLARQYVDKAMNVLPARRDPGWRGTTRYGSLRAHLKKDLGRKDDYESWLYMIVEITRGELPWRMVTDRNGVYEMKRNARKMRDRLFGSCPPTFNRLLEMIDALDFESTPNYQKIRDLLEQCCYEKGICMNEKYDWETCSIHLTTTFVQNRAEKSPSAQQRANFERSANRPL